MNAIQWVDRYLFYILNTQFTNRALDVLMPVITDKGNFMTLIVIGWLFIMFFGGRKERKVMIIILFVVLFSDFFASVLRYIVHRPRPCAGLEGVRLLAGCGGSYSFPSGHATNIFAAMVYLSLNYRRLAPIFVMAAIFVSYSRVYVGVHFPLDVLGGAFIGTIVAFTFMQGGEWVLSYLFDYYKRSKVVD